MKISQEVRDFAAAQEAADGVGIVDVDAGMEQMAEEYNKTGRQLYHKV